MSIEAVGEVSILNVGEGDTKLSFDKSNPADRERASKVMEQMFKSGFSVFIQVGEADGQPLYKRAHQFDQEACEYIIAGGPDDEIDIGAVLEGVRPKKKNKIVRVAAEKTRSVSVGRSAGG